LLRGNDGFGLKIDGDHPTTRCDGLRQREGIESLTGGAIKDTASRAEVAADPGVRFRRHRTVGRHKRENRWQQAYSVAPAIKSVPLESRDTLLQAQAQLDHIRPLARAFGLPRFALLGRL
jgi:hypothetical protein